MTTTMYAWTLLLASVATYLTRFPSLWLGRYLKITPRIKRGLDAIPLGVFAAMVGPAIFTNVHPAGTWDVAFIAATALAFLAAWFTKNPLWTMLVGVVAIAVVRLV